MNAPSGIQWLKEKYGPQFEGYLSLFNKQTKLSEYFDSEQWDKLKNEIKQQARKADLYIALGTQNARLSSEKRGGAETVAAVYGCVADIDFKENKNSKKNYPKNEKEAMSILKTFPLKPTSIIRTGNGLHAHWDFIRPLITRTAEDRSKAKRLVSGFQLSVQDHFRKYKREIDNVGDLTRLYRIPETFNHKSSPPTLVQFLTHDPKRRYEVGQIEELVATKDTRTKKARILNNNASHHQIVEGCAWYKGVVDGSASMDEPNWFAGASITARCDSGEKIFHEYSARHPGYNERQASQKFKHALEDGGPRTCKAIENDLGFLGCKECPFYGRISSPVQLGLRNALHPYDPGDIGPLVLGYAGSEFIFRNQQTQEVVRKSSMQLSIPSGLLELAPKKFWETYFPRLNKDGVSTGAVDWLGACDGLIQACRAKGAIEISSIRGIGVWNEKSRIVINLGGETIESSKFVYTSPKRIQLIRSNVSTDAILAFLRQPHWTTENAAELLLGWAFSSVLCGTLTWRPHAGVTGAAQAGKSTVLRGIGYILSPLAIIKEGISTEAGIRQSIGYDARPVILDELEPESASDRGRVARIVKLMRSSSSAVGTVARGTPEGKAINFATHAMFLIGAINLYRISAADTSRLVKFELEQHESQLKRRGSSDILQLLHALEEMGPSFCQLAIDHAADVIESISLIHRALPVVQERQADNMATLIAGYWVAQNRRRIMPVEVNAFVDQFANAVAEQKEGVELDDATECLNVLLGTSVFVTQESTNDDGNTFTSKETMPLGAVIANAYSSGSESGTWISAMDQHGIKLEENGFVVANSHPGLDRLFRGSRWEGKLWGSALGRLEDARRVPQRRFSDGVRSLAVWIPQKHLPDVERLEW